MRTLSDPNSLLRIHHNSDWSGDVLIINGGLEVSIPSDDLLCGNVTSAIVTVNLWTDVEVYQVMCRAVALAVGDFIANKFRDTVDNLGIPWRSRK